MAMSRLVGVKANVTQGLSGNVKHGISRVAGAKILVHKKL
jgi:hypothetical protein